MSTAPLLITGYAYSVYTRAVRMALHHKGVDYGYHEADPFDLAQQRDIPHPFGRVPVLTHGAFQLYETQAILDYIDMARPGTALTSEGLQAKARMRQVMGITDAYVYGPLVRQVVSQAVFAPLEGAQADAYMIEQGMKSAPQTFAALEEIATEGQVLNGRELTLADCLLWPMIDYFRGVTEGADELDRHPALRLWAFRMVTLPAAQNTAPDLERYEA
jgi:glutathione S-transferase